MVMWVLMPTLYHKVIDKDGLSMSKEKIETVLNFPLPKEVTALRGFFWLSQLLPSICTVPFGHGQTTSNNGGPKALRRAPI